MKNIKQTVLKIMVIVVCFSFMVFPFQSAKAFWLFDIFEKKPSSVPSDELTLILDAGKRDLVDKLGGAARVSDSCEAVIMELALSGMVELLSKKLLDDAKKTFISIQKMILAGMGKEGVDIVVGMTKKAFEELMEQRQQQNKEKDEKVVLSRDNTNTGCDYKMTVDWLKKEKRVHISMEGDCKCKPQLETRVPLSKFKTEFDVRYYYEEMDYQMEDGEMKKVYGVFGGLEEIEEKEGTYKHPFGNFCQTWYHGRDIKKAECGCRNGEPVKEVSAGPGIIKPNSALAFVDTAAERIGMFFTFTPEKKVKRALGYADEKLAEIAVMADAGDFINMGKAGNQYGYLLNVISRESKKVKGERAAEISDLVTDGLSVDKETLERIISQNVSDDELVVDEETLMEIISRNTYTPEEEREKMKEVYRHLFKKVYLLGEILSEFGREMSPLKEPPALEEADKKELLKEEIKKEETKEEGKTAEKEQMKEIPTPPQPEPAGSSEPIQDTASSPVNVCGDSRVAGAEECDPPGGQAQCYEGEICNNQCLCEYQQVEDVCGDGKITGSEICDGAQFSQLCLDAVEEYKQAMNNPNLVPRCFNNCRGCEASVPAGN